MTYIYQYCSVSDSNFDSRKRYPQKKESPQLSDQNTNFLFVTYFDSFFISSTHTYTVHTHMYSPHIIYANVFYGSINKGLKIERCNIFNNFSLIAS